ncbi:MAG: hypothetical protein ABIH83_04315 [Candidatus Micrarchaeota archaeon]
MMINPSVKGYFIKQYSLAALFAIVLFIAGIVAMLEIWGILIAIGLFGVGIAIIIIGIAHSILNSSHTKLYTTEDGVAYEKGVLSHHKIKAHISMITDSTIQRSFTDKIIGVAALQINTSGTAEREIVAEDFMYADVDKMNDEIHNMIRKNASKMQRIPPGADALAHEKK